MSICSKKENNNSLTASSGVTDNIFLNEKRMFYKDKTVKQVKNYNWHKILREYGWEKLPKKWINKFLKKEKPELLPTNREDTDAII